MGSPGGGAELLPDRAVPVLVLLRALGCAAWSMDEVGVVRSPARCGRAAASVFPARSFVRRTFPTRRGSQRLSWPCPPQATDRHQDAPTSPAGGPSHHGIET